MSCEEVSSWLLLIIFYIHYHKAYITILNVSLYYIYIFFALWYERTLLWDFNDDAFIVSWEKGEANERVRKLNKDADMESDMWA
jgi:hypothetical protein